MNDLNWADLAHSWTGTVDLLIITVFVGFVLWLMWR